MFAVLIIAVMLSAIVSFEATAQEQSYVNYLAKPGTTWCFQDLIYELSYNFSLKKGGMFDGFETYRITNYKGEIDEKSERLRVDGDKVYVLNSLNEWKLTFDFSLQVGEGTYVWNPFFPENSRGYQPLYLVCVKRYPHPDDPSFIRMQLIQYESKEEYENSAISGEHNDINERTNFWTCGIGGLQGILQSTNQFVGAGSLIELGYVEYGGNVVFGAKPESGVFNIPKTDGDDSYIIEGNEIRVAEGMRSSLVDIKGIPYREIAGVYSNLPKVYTY